MGLDAKQAPRVGTEDSGTILRWKRQGMDLSNDPIVLIPGGKVGAENNSLCTVRPHQVLQCDRIADQTIKD